MKALKSYIEALHRDERGEIPVGPLLIIGMIVIPLIVLLVAFKEQLVGKFETKQKEVLGDW